MLWWCVIVMYYKRWKCCLILLVLQVSKGSVHRRYNIHDKVAHCRFRALFSTRHFHLRESQTRATVFSVILLLNKRANNESIHTYTERSRIFNSLSTLFAALPFQNTTHVFSLMESFHTFCSESLSIKKKQKREKRTKISFNSSINPNANERQTLISTSKYKRPNEIWISIVRR